MVGGEGGAGGREERREFDQLRREVNMQNEDPDRVGNQAWRIMHELLAADLSSEKYEIRMDKLRQTQPSVYSYINKFKDWL